MIAGCASAAGAGPTASMISIRAVSGCVRMSDEIEVSVLNRKCGLIWLASASILRGQQQLLLFLQPVLDARVVPDLDRRRDAQHRREHDQSKRPGGARRRADRTGGGSPNRCAERLAEQLERRRREQQHDLPVDLRSAGASARARRWQAGEHERREVPDRFLRAQLAQAAAGEPAADRERQRDELAGEERRAAPTSGADDGAGVRPGDQPGEKRALERQVGGVVVQQQARRDARRRAGSPRREREDQAIRPGRAARRSGCGGSGGTAPASSPARHDRQLDDERRQQDLLRGEEFRFHGRGIVPTRARPPRRLRRSLPPVFHAQP